ncbi:lytic murein transglycosylase [Rhizobium leguminosarum]|uniref:Lytic murein transglycosylase n=1 Tax=Rhizobium leguminosarum TaxID=384 RepID=A0A4Q8Y4H4_RHILE|nr:lytic murein transglycosylase [Rhizobium leguminosarum]TAV59423.1 lytic murein transglycosylase [Rhizobium leguminosarum]TAV70470.1 lytic murein transglycosylase [Rhizobium leguminosarum]TAX31333.1 lytic murein transglycosylase [Rhizobium leguminosarum]TAX56928.1 lytic murein transglycosylase [Rhizobium leguminosarum]
MRFRRLSSRVTPLCPAGHLPHKGGDRHAETASPNNERPLIQREASGDRRAILLPISPPVGEMPGRAEGGGCPVDANQWGQSL